LDPKAERTACKYNCHAVLVHSGDVHGGHYYSFIRPRPENVWFKFDDERVTKVLPREAFEEGFGGGKEFVYWTNGRKVVSTTQRFSNACIFLLD